MDLVIIPSYHSKNNIEHSVYQYKNNNGQVVGELKNTTDLEVLFEGIDTELYKENENIKIDNSHPLFELQNIPEDFCFLSVGQ
jgi:hypothetical protein